MAFSAGTVTSSFVWKMKVGGVSSVTDSSPDKLFASSGSGFCRAGISRYFPGRTVGILPWYYASVGDTPAAFRLGEILSVSPVKVSVSPSHQISQQQLAHSNVIFVGSPRAFGDQLRGLPIGLEFVMDEKGVQNLHPRSGEPARLDNHYPGILPLESSIPDTGEVYTIVTRSPGPLGYGDIQSFSANHGPGSSAAVEWFTQPNQAKILASRLRKANGEIPRYFQVVLDVRFTDGVPTQVSYVMHRELEPKGK
jgi:hypothetical protein